MYSPLVRVGGASARAAPCCGHWLRGPVECLLRALLAFGSLHTRYSEHRRSGMDGMGPDGGQFRTPS
eukprot:811585-Alexandrium_andersonii.AAC.1